MSSVDPRPGRPHPLGATPTADGVNFSVWARHATRLELLLFDDAEAPRPSRVIPLDPSNQRTYHYWHTFVPGVRAGQVYAYRASGPYAPARGMRFDADKAAAAAVRRQVFGMIATDRIPFIGYHMPFPGLGYVEPLGDGFRYVPVSYQMMLNG